jgi:uncharacterized protein
MMGTPRRLLIGVPLCIFVFGAYLALQAFWFEPQSLTVREIGVQSPQWKGAPVRIALLSDIHGDEFHMPVARVKSLAGSAASLKPDIVLLGGDYAGGHFKKSHPPGASLENRTEAENAFESQIILALGEFRAPLGVFAVMGNHDCWWSCDEVRRLFSQTSIRFLENASFRVERPGGSFWIVGLEDEWTQAPDFKLATRAVPPGSDVLTLAHNPGLFKWPANQAAVQFSGHSHGGQVRFPFIGAPVRKSHYTEETMNAPFLENGRALIVTTGVGEIGLPVRFGVAPEILLVTLSNGPVVQAKTSRRKPIKQMVP